MSVPAIQSTSPAPVTPAPSGFDLDQTASAGNLSPLVSDIPQGLVPQGGEAKLAFVAPPVVAPPPPVAAPMAPPALGTMPGPAGIQAQQQSYADTFLEALERSDDNFLQKAATVIADAAYRTFVNPFAGAKDFDPAHLALSRTVNQNRDFLGQHPLSEEGKQKLADRMAGAATQSTNLAHLDKALKQAIQEIRASESETPDSDPKKGWTEEEKQKYDEFFEGNPGYSAEEWQRFIEARRKLPESSQETYLETLTKAKENGADSSGNGDGISPPGIAVGAGEEGNFPFTTFEEAAGAFNVSIEEFDAIIQALEQLNKKVKESNASTEALFKKIEKNTIRERELEEKLY